MAGSDGTVLLHVCEENWRLKRCPPPESLRKVVVVDWLGPNVVLRVCQKGAVKLWDLRSGAASSEPRLQHPSAINYVRSIHQDLVVVASFKNELHTYYLRYANRPGPRSVTQPYDRIPTYRNRIPTHQSVGLDIHRNLVAAGSDDERVQIFDIKKGAELQSGNKNMGANASCVRFVDEQRYGYELKVMVAAGLRIEGWALKGPGERNALDRDEALCWNRWWYRRARLQP